MCGPIRHAIEYLRIDNVWADKTCAVEYLRIAKSSDGNCALPFDTCHDGRECCASVFMNAGLQHGPRPHSMATCNATLRNVRQRP